MMLEGNIVNVELGEQGKGVAQPITMPEDAA